MVNTETYIVIQWPEIQAFMNLDDFEDNSYLIDDEKGVEDFGSSAYFVNKEWLENLNKDEWIKGGTAEHIKIALDVLDKKGDEK